MAAAACSTAPYLHDGRLPVAGSVFGDDGGVAESKVLLREIDIRLDNLRKELQSVTMDTYLNPLTLPQPRLPAASPAARPASARRPHLGSASSAPALARPHSARPHSARPTSAARPQPAIPASVVSRDQPTKLYMASFETRQSRDARRQAQKLAEKRAAGEFVGAEPKKAYTRARAPPPGLHPVGYRLISHYRSTPAYTMASKIVLSANVDPLIPDDTPGPGEYDTEKY